MKAQARLILHNQVECNLRPRPPLSMVGSQAPRGYMRPCNHRAGAQVYNPPLACQVQVPSRENEALLRGVIAENGRSVEGGFVSPRSEQGMPTIAEMVEGIPGAHQLISRVGSFFRVARTEVTQVPAVHVTPPRSTTRSTVVLMVPWGVWLWEMGVWVRMVVRHLKWVPMVHWYTSLVCSTSSREGGFIAKCRCFAKDARTRAKSPAPLWSTR